MTSSEISKILGDVITDSLNKINFNTLSDDQKELVRKLVDEIYKEFVSRIDPTRVGSLHN